MMVVLARRVMRSLIFPVRVTTNAFIVSIVVPLQQKLIRLGVKVQLGERVTTLNPKRLSCRYVVSSIPPACYDVISDEGLYPLSLRRLRKKEGGARAVTCTLHFKRPVPFMEEMFLYLHDTPWHLHLQPWSTTTWTVVAVHVELFSASDDSIPSEVIRQIRASDACGGWNDPTILSSVRRVDISHRADLYHPASQILAAGSRIGPRTYVCGGSGTLEGAVESGKKAARAVLNQMGHSPAHMHRGHRYIVCGGMMMAGLLCVVVIRSLSTWF